MQTAQRRSYSQTMTNNRLHTRLAPYPICHLLSSILLPLLLCALPASAANTLTWNTNQNHVTADIKGGELLPVLEQIASETGWHIFVEQDTIHNRVSAKFDDAKVGEALHLLLVDVNYALVPQNKGRSKLFVFRTSQANATMLVAPSK